MRNLSSIQEVIDPNLIGTNVPKKKRNKSNVSIEESLVKITPNLKCGHKLDFIPLLSLIKCRLYNVSHPKKKNLHIINYY